MTNKIKAEIISHSKRNNTGEEIITYKLTFPRIILSEVNTYKMLEKNTSSSRAIPFDKMVEVVEKEPFVPIAWQLSHRGMQSNEYITNPYVIEKKKGYWLDARDKAITAASDLVSSEIKGTHYEQNEDGSFKEKSVILINNSTVTKQLANRLLEPFMWVTQLITGSRESFEHLFEQRCPIYNVDVHFTSPDGLIISSTITGKSKKEVIKFTKENSVLNDFSNKDDLWWLQHNKGQAEIHFMDLAEKMYDALNESTPDELYDEEWHVSFKEEILKDKETKGIKDFEDLVKMSCAMTARISYTKIGDENNLTLEQAKRIYDKCKEQGHFSVFGHIAKCMTNEEYRSWYKGYVPTKTITNGEGKESTMLEINSFVKARGYNKNLKGFISLRQYIEDNVELKDA